MSYAAYGAHPFGFVPGQNLLVFSSHGDTEDVFRAFCGNPQPYIGGPVENASCVCCLCRDCLFDLPNAIFIRRRYPFSKKKMRMRIQKRGSAVSKWKIIFCAYSSPARFSSILSNTLFFWVSVKNPSATASSRISVTSFISFW